MSGTPKYSQAELDRQRQQQLEAERQRSAEAEARRRAEAEERERQRQLENRRQQAQRQLQDFANRMPLAEAYPNDIQQAQAQHRQLQQQVNRASVEWEVQSALAELVKLDRQFDQAIAQKRRDDEEKKRLAELEKQQLRVAELERAIARIPAADAAKFDSDGKNASRQAIDATQRAIVKGNPEAVRSPLAQAPQPFLVAGDFNLPSDSAIYRRDWASLPSAFETAGNGFGTSKRTGWFGVRIDHILLGPGWTCDRAFIGPHLNGDHRPLVADLTWSG